MFIKIIIQCVITIFLIFFFALNITDECHVIGKNNDDNFIFSPVRRYFTIGNIIGDIIAIVIYTFLTFFLWTAVIV